LQSQVQISNKTNIKNMDTTVLKCPGCGSPLPYDASIGKWKCESCGSIFGVEEINKMTQDSDLDTDTQKNPNPPNITSDPNDPQPDLNVYRCKNCGAEMVADDTTAATFCVYCGSTSILKNRLEGEFRPSRVIPFAKKKEDAINAFKNLMHTENFVPDDFTKESNIEKITGVYIPFWLYSGNVSGHIQGRLHKIQTWRSGDYKYTKTDIYDCERAGSVAFDGIPADGSKKFDDDTMDSIEPFDLTALEKFNYAYLSNFLAEKYDVTADEDQERAAQRMRNTIISHLEKTINGTLISPQQNVKEKIENIEYVMLPVWMLNTFWQGKAYTFAMNGQTGKLVGQVPVDKGKWFRSFLITSVICTPIAYIIIKIIEFFMD
jgi:DNA-directed RNA polymerase subunit RPC12/RpoP